MWSYTSTTPYIFMVWSLIKHRKNFNFYLTQYAEESALREEF
jgi:hypothetical protein